VADKKKIETPKQVDKAAFDKVLGKLISTPPIRSSEITGKRQSPKT
jgi:hypothetical protein